LEYAYNDFCLSQVAKKMGKSTDYQKYLKRSLNCYNLFNPETKFFWAKKSNGQWVPDFSPTLHGTDWWRGEYYTEGTPWQYSMDVLQDIKGLIQRHGGNVKFGAFLDKFFDGGYYTQENEPDIYASYLYDYIKQPYKTAERVRKLLDTKYQNKRTGLPGNDDSGCMSSWYVFSSMGFYPIAGQDLYLIGTPLFSHIKIDLGNGNFFTIIAHNANIQNQYITTAKLNGKILDRTWFRHSDIIHGATLELEMSSSPSDWGTKGESPPSPSYVKGRK
jgi:predicted alpha-1,2-mannosidase